MVDYGVQRSPGHIELQPRGQESPSGTDTHREQRATMRRPATRSRWILRAVWNVGSHAFTRSRSQLGDALRANRPDRSHRNQHPRKPQIRRFFIITVQWVCQQRGGRSRRFHPQVNWYQLIRRRTRFVRSRPYGRMVAQVVERTNRHAKVLSIGDLISAGCSTTEVARDGRPPPLPRAPWH